MLSLLITLVIAGFLLWLVAQIPMDPTIKRIVLGVAILIIVLWLLQSFGLFTLPGSLRLR